MLFDAILLCEPFLSDKNHDIFNIPGYTFISRHRKHYRQGGVKNNIDLIIRDDLSIFIETSFLNTIPGSKVLKGE